MSRGIFDHGAEETVDEPGLIIANLTGTTAVTGTAIDRMPTHSSQGFMSMKYVAGKGVPLGTPATATVTLSIGRGTGSSSADSYAEIGTMSGTTAVDILQGNINLKGYDRYLYPRLTPNVAGAGTIPAFCALVLGGALHAPVTDDT